MAYHLDFFSQAFIFDRQFGESVEHHALALAVSSGEMLIDTLEYLFGILHGFDELLRKLRDDVGANTDEGVSDVRIVESGVEFDGGIVLQLSIGLDEA